MPSKKRPTRPAPKVPTPPREPRPPKVEQPAADPTTKEAWIEPDQKVLDAAKPSEETEAVYRVMAEAYGPSSAGDRDRIEAAAVALVRRFPGLTHKPRLPRAAHEDQQQAKRGRLPDGSIVLAVWEEYPGRWVGHLLTEPPKGLVGVLSSDVAPYMQFATNHPGVFGLLKKLDGLYREWLGRQKK